MREVIAFPCGGDTLNGTLDDAGGTTGLLIVSGGNEIRCGAHRGMAQLAAELSAAGIPVFRFDRRGIGDSEGANHGYEDSADDITAAVRTFRMLAPQIRSVIGFGNCDGATALALFHRDAGIDRLVLANPWVGDEDDGLPPVDAIRSHYADRMKKPAHWLRLLAGGVNLINLVKGLRKVAANPREAPNLIAGRMAVALVDTPRTILLADRDNTAKRFDQAWRDDDQIERRETDSHSFARPGDADWLRDKIKEAIARS